MRRRSLLHKKLNRLEEKVKKAKPSQTEVSITLGEYFDAWRKERFDPWHQTLVELRRSTVLSEEYAFGRVEDGEYKDNCIRLLPGTPTDQGHYLRFQSQVFVSLAGSINLFKPWLPDVTNSAGQRLVPNDYVLLQSREWDKGHGNPFTEVDVMNSYSDDEDGNAIDNLANALYWFETSQNSGTLFHGLLLEILETGVDEIPPEAIAAELSKIKQLVH